jgi:hypothetical protein
MKKFIRLSLLTLVVGLLVALVPSVSRALENDASGPACRDITNATFSYSSTGTLNAQLLLGPAGTTPACKNVTYTLYVIVDGTNEATALAFPKDGSAQWLNEITITDDDNDICVFATTATGRVFDRAPDADCLPLTRPTTGGGGGIN